MKFQGRLYGTQRKNPGGAQCFFCGGPYQLAVSEVYPEERAFTLEACCQGAYEDVIAWLNEPIGSGLEVPRKEFADWFAAQTGIKVRGCWVDEGGRCRYHGLALDYGLQERPISQKDAKAWVRQHHRHLPDPPAGWKWGHSVWNGDDLIGIAMVGAPTGRWSPSARPGIVEVTRVAIRDDLRRGLVWNAASMLYGAAAREAKRRGYARIITYSREDETGVSLKAAGWERGPQLPARYRSDPRPGRKKGEKIARYRWTRWLKRQANPIPAGATPYREEDLKVTTSGPDYWLCDEAAVVKPGTGTTYLYLWITRRAWRGAEAPYIAEPALSRLRPSPEWKLAGYMRLRNYRLPPRRPQYIVDGVALAPAARNKRLGAYLYSAAADFAAAAGGELISAPWNRTLASERIWRSDTLRRHGYEVERDPAGAADTMRPPSPKRRPNIGLPEERLVARWEGPEAAGPRGNPYEPTKRMLQAMGDIKCSMIVAMRPGTFLNALTESVGHRLDIERHAQPLEVYNRAAREGQTTLMPMLRIRVESRAWRLREYAPGGKHADPAFYDLMMRTGEPWDAKIVGHEGRHRAAAALANGESQMAVAICVRSDDRAWAEYIDPEKPYQAEYKVTYALMSAALGYVAPEHKTGQGFFWNIDTKPIVPYVHPYEWGEIPLPLRVPNPIPATETPFRPDDLKVGVRRRTLTWGRYKTEKSRVMLVTLFARDAAVDRLGIDSRLVRYSADKQMAQLPKSLSRSKTPPGFTPVGYVATSSDRDARYRHVVFSWLAPELHNLKLGVYLYSAAADATARDGGVLKSEQFMRSSAAERAWRSKTLARHGYVVTPGEPREGTDTMRPPPE